MRQGPCPPAATIAPMGTLTLVRHGQASFGAADYDRLSDLGTRQCRELGRWFRERGLAFEAVLCGTLRRHEQSQPTLALREDLDSAEAYRAHFRLLRAGLAAWIEGRAVPAGMPAWPEFLAGITAALDHVRQRHQGDVLIVSSGGPIATAPGPPRPARLGHLRLNRAAASVGDCIVVVPGHRAFKAQGRRGGESSFCREQDPA